MRPLGRESLLPIFLRRGVFPAQAAVRPVILDPLAAADGRGAAEGADPGKPERGHPDGSGQAERLFQAHRRHDGAAQECDVPDRRPAAASRPRTAGPAGEGAGRDAAPVLCAGRQARADQVPALCPCPSVQARRQGAQDAQNPARPRDPRHRAQDQGQSGLEEAFARPLHLAGRVHRQDRRQRGPKVYSLHAPEVECIGKGKAHKPYEFGVKVTVATPVYRCKGGQFVAHVQALPGNPYDGHTLARIIPAAEAQIGASLARIVADAGYRGHNAPEGHKLKVYTSGQKRGVTQTIKRELKRRSAVEPVIGHLKSDHRMERNYLAHASGDAINAILAAVGYNFRLLLRWLALLCAQILAAFSAPRTPTQRSIVT